MVEVLLQRTRAAQVAPVFEELRRRYPSARDFGAASVEELAALIAPLGLRWRVPLLARLAREIGERRGRITRDVDALQRLPGVGPYAAAAVLSLHANMRAVIIDANVVRVLCRLVGEGYDGETRRRAWLGELADRLTPVDRYREYNYAVLDLAMSVCLPRSPRCDVCPLQARCATGLATYDRETVPSR